MNAPSLLVIDAGTTNAKALMMGAQGQTLARGSHPLDIRYPQPGWVEQDALDIWQGVRIAIDACLTVAGGRVPGALAITNQREAVMVWERESGRPIGPVVGWQCRRTAAQCEELRARGIETLLRERTGLGVDPLFSASKVRWLLDHIPSGQARAEQGDLCMGTVDSWLVWNLTGGLRHVTDVTNASRTQLLNIHTLTWDADLLSLFEIPEAMLPTVNPSAGVVGTTIGHGMLPAGVPIAAVIGDSHSALFGQCGFEVGVVKATYGTGSSLMTVTTAPILSSNLSATIAWQWGDVTYALEGNIPVTGSGMQWMARLLGLNGSPEALAHLAASASSGSVIFVPALVGLGAPYWDSDARGLICGLSFDTAPAHLARATVESIAFQICDVFYALEAATGLPLQVLLADGGASRNDALMQFQADLLGRPLVRSESPDVSALGAGYLAGIILGIWHSLEDIAQLPRHVDRFEPQLSPGESSARYTAWLEAVARCQTQLDPSTHTPGKVGAV